MPELKEDSVGTLTLGDLNVRRLGFGSMRLTGKGVWGAPDDPEAAKAVLRRAVELGIDLIDTADSYGPYVAENLIREALHPYPHDLVIATKAGLERHDATPSQIALAWLLNRSPAMLPIPGTSSIDHLEENVGAAQIVLTDGDMAELSAAA